MLPLTRVNVYHSQHLPRSNVGLLCNEHSLETSSWGLGHSGKNHKENMKCFKETYRKAKGNSPEEANFMKK